MTDLNTLIALHDPRPAAPKSMSRTNAEFDVELWESTLGLARFYKERGITGWVPVAKAERDLEQGKRKLNNLRG